MDFTRNTSSKKCPSTILGPEKTPKKKKKVQNIQEDEIGPSTEECQSTLQ